MGNSGEGRGGGGDRWREREQNWHRDRDYGREQGRGGGGAYRGGGGDDDRGFFDRAGDELRSWFGDDDAQRRREADQRRWEQEQRMTGRRDNDYGRGDYRSGSDGPGSLGGGGFGAGWGNQRGESWNRERPGERGWYGAGPEQEQGGGDRHYARGEREGWFTDSRGGERGERQGGAGGYRGSGSGSGSSASGGFGGETLRGQGGGYGGLHDPHYSEWRQRQIEDLDRDYADYRREHQSKFEQEFGSWRSKRQGQRQSLGRVAEHMEVVGSDGSHVGSVDKVRGDRIILTKADPAAGGVHHSVPCSWVDKVEDKVVLNRSADQARSDWQAEGEGQALFREGRDAGEGGPRNLNRSFSGTYDEGRETGRDDRDG
ncbi:MAG TPA: DUF2171 domain-containing protein [Allosphingosinicella sp.]|jgi:hypothetical protein